MSNSLSDEQLILYILLETFLSGRLGNASLDEFTLNDRIPCSV